MPDLPAGVVVADTVTKPTEDWKGAVLIAASHGGVYAAWCAARAGVRAVILNDAGRGRDDAGIGGGAWCAARGMAYAAVDTLSCRIGNGGDMAARGVVSVANPQAAALGVTPGMAAAEAASLLTGAPLSEAPVEDLAEARSALPPGPSGRRILLLDSASLVRPEDAGHVIVTGSHGGILGGDPNASLKADGYAAFFNDAGGGADDAGCSRLPALDIRGVAAATVDAMSARIGDGRSTYEDGVISRLNETAARLGAMAGMPLRAFADSLVD